MFNKNFIKYSIKLKNCNQKYKNEHKDRVATLQVENESWKLRDTTLCEHLCSEISSKIYNKYYYADTTQEQRTHHHNNN